MMRTIQEPRHRTRPVSGPWRALGYVRHTLGGALGIAAALVIALAATGGTYAYLNDSASVASSGVVRAGSAAISVTGSPVSLSGLYPGATRYAAVTVTNSGTVAVALHVDSLTRTSSANSFAGALTIGVGVAPTAAACTSGTVAATWTGTFASAPAGAVGSATIAPGASSVVCLSTTLAANAPTTAQSSNAAYTLTLGGRQS